MSVGNFSWVDICKNAPPYEPIEVDDSDVPVIDFDEVWRELGTEIKKQVKFEKGNHEKYKSFRPSWKPCERIDELVESLGVEIKRTIREINKGYKIVGLDVSLKFSYWGANRVKIDFGSNKVELDTIVELRDRLFSDSECFVRSVMGETGYIGTTVLEVVVVNV